jgi:hypothetical protein
MVACTQQVKYTPDVIVGEDSVLMQQCTGDTPVPENPTVDTDGNRMYNGKSAMDTFTRWQLVYDECATRHDSLIKLIKDIQQDRKIILKK